MNTYYTALPFTPHDTSLHRLYEPETLHSITVLQGLDPIWTSCLANLVVADRASIVLSPDGTHLAIGRRDNISLWDTRTTTIRYFLHIEPSGLHNKDFYPISFSESTVATVWGGCLYISDTTTGTKRATWELSGNNVYAVAFSSGGKYLLLSMDQSLQLYRGADASELSVLPTDQHHRSVIFTRDDGQIITRSEEGQVHFFSLSRDTLSEIPGRSISTQAVVVGLVLCHDGQRLATSGMDGTIRIYELASLACVGTLQRPGSGSAITAMACHPIEEELVTGQDECVVLWRKEAAGDWVASIHGHHTSPINGVGYCENGTRIYTGSQDGNIKLWENTKTQFRQSPKHTETITCYAVDARASLLATGSRDMSVILWGVTKGDYLRTLLGHKREVLSLEFSEDGVLLASGSSDDRAIVWDVASGNVLHVLGPHSGCGRVLSFGETDRHLTTATSQEIYVWELKSGELMGIQERDTQVNDAPKRPYSAFTFSDIEQSQDLQHKLQESQVLSQMSQQVSQVLQELLQLLPQEHEQEELLQLQQQQQQQEEQEQSAQEEEEEDEQAAWSRRAALLVVQGGEQAAALVAQWQQAAEQAAQWQQRQELELAQAQEQAQAQELSQAARDSDHAKWLTKYLGWRLPRGYRVATTLVMEDRVVHLCKDGRVLILDTSRMEEAQDSRESDFSKQQDEDFAQQ